jgi:hypothetical protein
LKRRQDVINSPGVQREAMKIWQFAVLVLILAYGIYLAAWVYTGIGREIALITKYQVR